MHVGTTGVSVLPQRFESRQGFVALHRSFPGTTASPVEIVVQNGAPPETARTLAALRSQLTADPRFGPGRIERARDGVTVLSVPVQGDPDGKAAISAVRDLRSTIVPAAFATTDATVDVGGRSSENVDYIDSAIGPAPMVIALVLGLTLVLLTTVFRSLVVAGLTVALNLLSVAAAYGLIVLVFQHGVGAGIFGFQHVDVIEAWVPLFLFSVLFGLSMDYQVFLLSRIKERYDLVGDTTNAVTFGVASTARIITGAALIIVAAFTGFARGEMVMFQQMGFGVAVALLIDATIVRSVLLPSTLRLLGRWSWYLPSWLGWLPRVHVEAPPQVATSEAT
jgi:RND superfamily putative drug exporter